MSCENCGRTEDLYQVGTKVLCLSCRHGGQGLKTVKSNHNTSYSGLIKSNDHEFVMPQSNNTKKGDSNHSGLIKSYDHEFVMPQSNNTKKGYGNFLPNGLTYKEWRKQRRQIKIEIEPFWFLVFLFLGSSTLVVLGMRFVWALLIFLIGLPFSAAFSKSTHSNNKSNSNKAIDNESRRITLEKVNLMSGIEFEQTLAKLFRKMGYNCLTTKSSHDHGVDLILEKGKDKIAVQAKRYGSSVSVSAVYEANAGKTVYGCNQAWVVTNNDFTDDAIKVAHKCDVRLIRGSLLTNWLQEYNIYE